MTCSSANASTRCAFRCATDSVRSINLSTAVGIVTYAALAAIGFPGLQ